MAFHDDAAAAVQYCHKWRILRQNSIWKLSFSSLTAAQIHLVRPFGPHPCLTSCCFVIRGRTKTICQNSALATLLLLLLLLLLLVLVLLLLLGFVVCRGLWELWDLISVTIRRPWCWGVSVCSWRWAHDDADLFVHSWINGATALHPNVLINTMVEFGFSRPYNNINNGILDINSMCNILLSTFIEKCCNHQNGQEN